MRVIVSAVVMSVGRRARRAMRRMMADKFKAMLKGFSVCPVASILMSSIRRSADAEKK